MSCNRLDLARKRNYQKRTPRPISRVGFLREMVLTPAEAILAESEYGLIGLPEKTVALFRQFAESDAEENSTIDPTKARSATPR